VSDRLTIRIHTQFTGHQNITEPGLDRAANLVIEPQNVLGVTKSCA